MAKTEAKGEIALGSGVVESYQYDSGGIVGKPYLTGLGKGSRLSRNI